MGEIGAHQSDQCATRRQAFLGALLQFFDQAFLAQRLALAGALLGVHQRDGGAGEEKPRALAALMGGKPAHRVIADAAIQRTVGGTHQVNEPGFGFRKISHGSIRQTRRAPILSTTGLKCPQAFERLGAHGVFQRGDQPSNSPLMPRAWRDQRHRSKWSWCSQILPSRNTKRAPMSLTTVLPVALNRYVATQWALPVLSSLRTWSKVRENSLARVVSMRHISPASRPRSSPNAGSLNTTSSV